MFKKRNMGLYSIGKCGTVDEMLLKFRGRCGFRRYMPSKPGYYGITDSARHYCYNIIPYWQQGSNQSWSKGCKTFSCTCRWLRKKYHLQLKLISMALFEEFLQNWKL